MTPLKVSTTSYTDLSVATWVTWYLPHSSPVTDHHSLITPPSTTELSQYRRIGPAILAPPHSYRPFLCSLASSPSSCRPELAIRYSSPDTTKQKLVASKESVARENTRSFPVFQTPSFFISVSNHGTNQPSSPSTAPRLNTGIQTQSATLKPLVTPIPS
jgi:hypothetical protein